MRGAPTPKSVLLAGMLIRLVAVYLPWSFVAGRASTLPTFFIVVLVIEIGCLMVFRRALNGGGGDLLLSSYLSVGDVVWFAGAVAFALLSGVVPTFGFAIMAAIWITALLANFYIVKNLRRRGPVDNVEKVVARSSPGKREDEASLNKIDRFVAIVMFAALSGVGMLGVILFYILDNGSWLLASLSIGFLGLGCGFSPQIRPMLMWRRLNGRPKV